MLLEEEPGRYNEVRWATREERRVRLEVTAARGWRRLGDGDGERTWSCLQGTLMHPPFPELLDIVCVCTTQWHFEWIWPWRCREVSKLKRELRARQGKAAPMVCIKGNEMTASFIQFLKKECYAEYFET